MKFAPKSSGEEKKAAVTKEKGSNRSRNGKMKKLLRTFQVAQVVKFTGVS